MSDSIPHNESGRRRRPGRWRLAGLGLVAGGVLASASFAGAADHLDAPAVQADGRTDINDLYAFQSPRDDDNLVLIMTVNPGAGVISGTTFHPKANYNFHIDEDGDAIADHTVTVDFGKVKQNGRQRYKVRYDGEKVAKGRVGRTVEVDELDGKIRAGVFEDPFFFDLAGFQAGLAFTGDDFFAPLNVSAIVLEIEADELADSETIGVWATTTDRWGNQIDRMGRPAINTVLIPADRKDEFNRADPVNDAAAFGDDVRATIAALNGGDTATAAALTAVLLPDILTIDVTDPSGFLNGRGLADDVIDAELSLLTNGAVTGDGVDANDVRFRNRFPYLARKN